MGTSLSGPVVKNLHRNARDTGSIPESGTKIPWGQLSSSATTTEPTLQLNKALMKKQRGCMLS